MYYALFFLGTSKYCARNTMYVYPNYVLNLFVTNRRVRIPKCKIGDSMPLIFTKFSLVTYLLLFGQAELSWSLVH